MNEATLQQLLIERTAELMKMRQVNTSIASRVNLLSTIVDVELQLIDLYRQLSIDVQAQHASDLNEAHGKIEGLTGALSELQDSMEYLQAERNALLAETGDE